MYRSGCVSLVSVLFHSASGHANHYMKVKVFLSNGFLGDMDFLAPKRRTYPHEPLSKAQCIKKHHEVEHEALK